MKIAVIGDETSTAGFKALGLDIFTVPEPGAAPDIWRSVDPDDYSVIFIAEPEYEMLTDEIAVLRGRTYPVVTVIPSVAGSRESGHDELKALVERAVGTDLVFRQE